MAIKNFNAAALKTPEGVKELMASSTSEREWNENADAVKAANDGYPNFWYKEVVLSGLAAKTSVKFNP